MTTTMTKGTHVRTLNDAIIDVEVGIEDAKADYPHLSDEDIFSAVVDSVAAQLPAPVGAELRRHFKGQDL